jgi:tRNA threonylcarbamoyl adenosine modification protein (Sua5/YciO/YrdC/YwlC family)/tRNA threonylcarbamoyl adenosine modification protein YjeE
MPFLFNLFLSISSYYTQVLKVVNGKIKSGIIPDMEIVKYNGDENSEKALLEKIVQVLRAGGLVIMPTETVYGAMVDATNADAVKKLLSYKARRQGKPLSIAVSDEGMAEKYVTPNAQAKNLYAQFLPGPVTVVSRAKNQSDLAVGVKSEFDTVGVRIPDYKLVLDLIKEYGAPLTATSANGSGKKMPYAVSDILDNLSAKQKSLIDLIIDAGVLPKRPPSVVIDTTLSTPLIMRNSGAAHENTFVTKSEHETQELAGKLLLKYVNEIENEGLVIALNGQLGAGKTIFTKGVAKYLQIDEIISSPTYTYQKEYDFAKNELVGRLHHFDLWTIDNGEMFSALEIKSLFGAGKVVIIEWWENVRGFADFAPTIEIEIVAGASENERQISVKENEK